MDGPINFDEQISSEITSRMGDLSGKIGSTPYQQGSESQLPQGVNLTGVNDPSAPADVQALAGNVVPNSGIPLNNGVTPVYPQAAQNGGFVQPQNQNADAERQRLEQVAYEASMKRIDAEERAFQAEIAHLSDEDRERAVLERELGQTREVNNWLNQQVSGSRQQMTQLQQRQQQQAKNYWVIHVANQAGLPIENQAISAALRAAESPEHMRAIADELVNMVNGSARNTVQNQVNNGMFAAGGGNNAPAVPAGPKQRSGDISGLIASRGQVAIR